MEEMLEDTMEGLDDSEDLEEAAQEEIDKVLFDLTAGNSLIILLSDCNKDPITLWMKYRCMYYFYHCNCFFIQFNHSRY